MSIKALQIGIIGYGKMGAPLEEAIKKRGHNVALIVTDETDANWATTGIDVFIDFSTAAALPHNLSKVSSDRIPMVIGTTGWNEKIPEFEKMLVENRAGAIWSGNFSVGVNLYWNMLEQAVQQLRRFENGYDVSVSERHHRFKIDAPSGTAIRTAEIILDGSSTKSKMVTDISNRAPEADELHVGSIRGGYHPGQHIVTWDSEFDTIEFRHTARNRSGFAMGAVIAAEFLVDKQLRGLVPFSDIFSELKF